MTRIHLIRHGKASPENANYDELHPRGQQQSVLLGEHLAARAAHFDAWYSGPLTRQRDTLTHILAGAGEHGRAWPSAKEHVGLAEAPVETIMRHDLMLRAQVDAVVGELIGRLSAAEDATQRTRAIEALVEHMVVLWVRGEITRDGLESFVDFGRRVHDALQTIATESVGARDVAIVTSNNVIGWAIAHLDPASAANATTEHGGMLRRFWNSSITEVVFADGVFRVQSVNQVPHLPEDLLTYI
jgi:broad specificity phosphatase PhoE